MMYFILVQVLLIGVLLITCLLVVFSDRFTLSQVNMVLGYFTRGETFDCTHSADSLTWKPTYSCDKMKFLVFVCSGWQPCGGWGDRQRGIVSTYILAVLMNRTFSIILDKPCDISQFLIPYQYNWRSCHEYTKNIPLTRSNFHRVLLERNYSSIEHMLQCSNNKDCSRKQEKVIFVSTNQGWIERLTTQPNAKQMLPWTINKTVSEINKIVLAKLFRPSDVLENEIRNFTDKINGKKQLICSHIRIGVNPTIPNDKKKPSVVPNVRKIFGWLKQYDNPAKYAIYIASDSDNVRKLARTNFTNTITTDLPIIHVDKVRKDQANVACHGVFVTLLEQHILSRCHVLLLTPSNFGAMAAYMGQNLQKIFRYHQNNHKIFECNLSQVVTY